MLSTTNIGCFYGLNVLVMVSLISVSACKIASCKKTRPKRFLLARARSRFVPVQTWSQREIGKRQLAAESQPLNISLNVKIKLIEKKTITSHASDATEIILTPIPVITLVRTSYPTPRSSARSYTSHYVIKDRCSTNFVATLTLSTETMLSRYNTTNLTTYQNPNHMPG